MTYNLIPNDIPTGKFCRGGEKDECSYYVQNTKDGYCLKEKEKIIDGIKVCGINRENEKI